MAKVEDLENERQQLLAEEKHLRTTSALRGPSKEKAFQDLKAKWAFHHDKVKKALD